MTRSAPSGPLLRRAALAYALAVGAFALAAARLALRDRYPVPFVDDWRVLDQLDSRSLLAFLFGSQNGHLLPLTLALFAADQRWFGARSLLLTCASLASVALACGLLAGALRRAGALASPVARLALGFACFALVWAASGHDLLWGLNQGSLQAVALVVLALAALARVDPDDLAGSRGALALSAGAALGASLSQGMGAASWAALAAAALLLRLPARVAAGFAAAGALVVLAIAASAPAHPNISFGLSLAFAREHPLGLARYALAFAGSAPARVLVGLGAGAPAPVGAGDRAAWSAHTQGLLWLATLAGAAGLAGFAALALARWRRPVASRTPDALALGLMAFALAGALLAAFARGAVVGPASLVQTRFLTWSALLWIGLALALVPRGGGAEPGAAARGTALLLPLLSLAMLPALGDARRLQASSRALASRLAVALQLGLRPDALARSVSMHDVELVYRVAGRLAAQGRWPLDAEHTGLVGAPLRERFADAGACDGRIVHRQAADQTRPVAASVSGWLLPPPGAPRPRFVVLADPAGSIRGLASFEAAAPRPAEELGDNLVWSGFVVEPDPAVVYTAHAVLADGRSACRLAPPRGERAPLD